MDIIIRRMEKALHERQPRHTALRRLQMEEQDNPFKVLIATILSARTRDETTTKILVNLFRRFKGARDLAEADIEEIKAIIRSTGFYNTKAERIKNISQLIVEKFNGEVPDNIEKLLGLPGVGRKTANCVLVYAFNKAAIPVDVHVHRISNRLGLVNTKTPEKTEFHLSHTIRKKHWLRINQTFVMYGQNVCTPIKPKCKLCRLKSMCNFYQNTNALAQKNHIPFHE
jgi:endonuclease-3